MIQIDIRAHIKAAQAFLKEVEKAAYQRATARALNDTAKTVRAEGAREIKKKHQALKIGDIKRNMRMKSAFPGRLVATVDTTGRPLSLTLFRPHQLKRGGVKVTLGTQRIVIRYKGRTTFRVKRYGNEIFARKNASGRAIRRIRGPSMPGVFRARTTDFRGIVSRRFPKAFKSRMQYEIDRAAKRAAASQRGAELKRSGALTSFVERQFRLPAGSLR